MSRVARLERRQPRMNRPTLTQEPGTGRDVQPTDGRVERWHDHRSRGGDDRGCDGPWLGGLRRRWRTRHERRRDDGCFEKALQTTAPANGEAEKRYGTHRRSSLDGRRAGLTDHRYSGGYGSRARCATALGAVVHWRAGGARPTVIFRQCLVCGRVVAWRPSVQPCSTTGTPTSFMNENERRWCNGTSGPMRGARLNSHTRHLFSWREDMT